MAERAAPSFTCESCGQTFVPAYRGFHGVPRFCSRRCFGASLRAKVAARVQKSCTQCKAMLPISDFWKDSHSSDGHQAVCKECRFSHRRGAGRHAEISYRHSDKGADSARRSLKTLRSDPRKYAAHKHVQIAVANGLLTPQACEVCGTNSKVHAHHDDYARPLDVRWLCPVHHMRHHAEMRRRAAA